MATLALPVSADPNFPLPPLPPILATYARAPMVFVRGEGVELEDADGRRYLDLHERNRGQRARIRRRRSPCSDRGGARRAGWCTRPTCSARQPGEELARDAGRTVVRVVSVLLQLRRGGERGRVQVRAAVGARGTVQAKSRSSRCAAAFTGGCSRRSLRRTGRSTERRSSPLAPGVSIAERDLETLAPALSGHDCRPRAGAGAGRGRSARARPGLPCASCARSPSSAESCSFSTRSSAGWGEPGACSPTSTQESRPTW
jgi:hypothetical protein